MRNLPRLLLSALLLTAILVGVVSAYAQEEAPTATPIEDTPLVNNNREVLETVPAGEATKVLGRAGTQLIYVETVTGAKGWLPAEAVELSAPLDSLPRVSVAEVEFAAPSLAPAFTVAGDAVLADRPAATYNVVEKLFTGRAGTLLGITRAGNFFYVEMDSGAKGWLAVEAVSTAYPASRLPVARSGEAEIVHPPTPTATLLNDADLIDRASPSVFETLETLRAGEQATVLGRTRAGNFIYVETITSAKGWLAVENAELNVDMALLPTLRSGEVEVVMPAVGPTFTVTGEATLIDRPAATSNPVEALWTGRAGTLLGTTRAGNFYYVEMESGAKGWLPVEVVQTAYPVSRLSVVRSGEVEVVNPPTPTAAALADRVQVLSFPNTIAGTPVDFLNPGEAADVLNRSRWGNWVYVQTAAGAKGWVPVEAVALNINVAALQSVSENTAEVIAGPVGAVVAEQAVNLRAGPNVDTEVRAVVDPGTQLRLLGRDAAGSWLYVVLPSGTEGWMAGFLVDTQYDVMLLEVFAGL